VLEWLTNTSYAVWVRESWGWPFALTLHAFGNAMVVGLIYIICLRLLGLFQTIPYTSLNRLLPIIWAGVAIQVFSGFTLWASKPAKYLSDGMFLWKFSLVILGVVVTYYFHNTLKREAAAWRRRDRLPWGVQVVAPPAVGRGFDRGTADRIFGTALLLI
jgi:hypothetical protein